MTDEQFPQSGPAGHHEAFSTTDAAAAAANVLGLSGVGQPGGTPGAAQHPGQGGEQHGTSANTDTNRTERADVDLLEALRSPDTENVAYGAHIQERPFGNNASGEPVPEGRTATLSYAPNTSDCTAAIRGEGSRVDLQNSSYLGFPGRPEGARTRTNEPVLVVLSDGAGQEETFAYDNQVLTRLPDGWAAADRRDWEETGGSAPSPEQHARNVFNLPSSSSLSGDSTHSVNPHDERYRLLQDRVASTVTDGFVAEHTWHHADHDLPTEVVVGQPFGGDVMGDRRVEAVIVGSSALESSGRLDEPGYRNSRRYEQASSPVNSARMLQAAVQARYEAQRGPETSPPPPPVSVPPDTPIPEGF